MSLVKKRSTLQKGQHCKKVTCQKQVNIAKRSLVKNRSTLQKGHLSKIGQHCKKVTCQKEVNIAKRSLVKNRSTCKKVTCQKQVNIDITQKCLSYKTTPKRQESAKGQHLCHRKVDFHVTQKGQILCHREKSILMSHKKVNFDVTLKGQFRCHTQKVNFYVTHRSQFQVSLICPCGCLVVCAGRLQALPWLWTGMYVQ